MAALKMGGVLNRLLHPSTDLMGLTGERWKLSLLLRVSPLAVYRETELFIELLTEPFEVLTQADLQLLIIPLLIIRQSEMQTLTFDFLIVCRE